MPISYHRIVRLAREEAEAEGDSDTLMNRGGFRPVYPGDEPSEIDDWANATPESATKPKTKQGPGGLNHVPHRFRSCHQPGYHRDRPGFERPE